MKTTNIFLLFFIVNITAYSQSGNDTIERPEQYYNSLTPEQKKQVRTKSLNEFLDVNMFLDVIATRRFNYVDDNSFAGKFGNRKLRQTIDYFKEKTKTGVCVFCRIDKKHFWVTYMSGRGYRGNCDTTDGNKRNIFFEIKLAPADNETYQPDIKYSGGKGIFAELDTSFYIAPDALSNFKTYMDTQLPPLQRSEIRDKLNDKIVTGLLKLLGTDALPIVTTLYLKETRYGYDSCVSQSTRVFYEDLNVQGVPANYGIPPKIKWASVKKGESLPVRGRIQELLPDSVARSMQLKLDNSIKSTFTSKDSIKEFTVSGFSEGEQALKAVWQLEAGKGVDILSGQLNIAAYKEQTLKVTLVPLQGVLMPNVEDIQDELNRIYRQAVVQWEVSIDERLHSYSHPVATADDLNSDVLYSESMESVITAFNQGKRDKKTWYIFLMPKFSNESVSGMVLGYMPFQMQYGFAEYHDGQTLKQLARTIAHELGHGAFILRHTFPPSEYNIDNSYGNLMGYNDSTHLAKFQWDDIHNSKAGSKEFESAEEAMGLFNADLSGIRYKDTLLNNEQILYFVPEIEEEITFIAKRATKKGEEALNVQWTVKGKATKSDTLSMIIDNNFFGEKERVDVEAKDKVIFGKDSMITVYIEKIDIHIEQEIIKTLQELLNIEEAFNNVIDSINTEIKASGFDTFLIKGNNNIYTNKGMNQLLDTSHYTLTDNRLFNLMRQLYEIDVIIAKYAGEFDDIINKINTVMAKDENGKYHIIDFDFKNAVVSLIKEIPFSSKEAAMQYYQAAIKENTIKNISTDE